MADTFRLTFGAKSTVQDAAVVLIKDFKNARPGPSIYRVRLPHVSLSLLLPLPVHDFMVQVKGVSRV